MLPSPVLWSHLDFPRQHQLRGVITHTLQDVGGPCPDWSSCAVELAELVGMHIAYLWQTDVCQAGLAWYNM